MRIARVISATIICGVHRKELIIGRLINHKKTIIEDKRKRRLRAKNRPELQQGVRIIQHVKWPVSGSGERELPISGMGRKKSHQSSSYGIRGERIRTHLNNINQARRR